MTWVSNLLNSIKPQPQHTEEELAKVRRIPAGASSRFEHAMPTNRKGFFRQTMLFKNERQKAPGD